MRSMMCVLLLMTGCALQTGIKPYAPVALSYPADRDTLFFAVHANAVEQRWEVTKANPESGYLEAVSPAEQDGEFESRERWQFRVHDDAVVVRRIYEVKFDRSQTMWEHVEEVCESYEYVREQSQLDRIAKHARRTSAGAGARRVSAVNRP